MANMPSAELEVDANLVVRLLAEQYPEGAHDPVAELGQGWDNYTFAIGDSLVARLPRRETSVPLIRHEARWLPELAPRLPLPVPEPVFAGSPGHGYPWPWLVARRVPGRSFSYGGVVDLLGAARRLGQFLASLHVPAPVDAPANPYRGIPLESRDIRFREHLDMLAGEFDEQLLVRLWESALEVEPHRGPPVWIHGDLHPGNLLVSAGSLSGVVDFGDVTSGDPAVDLAIGWMMFPGPERAELWRAYGRGEPALRMRARAWALALGLAIVTTSDDNPAMRRIGRWTLDSICDEEASRGAR